MKKILDYIRDLFVKIPEVQPIGINYSLPHVFIVKIINNIISIEGKANVVYTHLTLSKSTYPCYCMILKCTMPIKP